MITGPSGPQKGRHQEGISAGRNPRAVLLVVDVSRFSAGGRWDAVLGKCLCLPLALLADVLYTSYICYLRISSIYLRGFLLVAEENEVAKPSFPVP